MTKRQCILDHDDCLALEIYLRLCDTSFQAAAAVARGLNIRDAEIEHTKLVRGSQYTPLRAARVSSLRQIQKGHEDLHFVRRK